MSTVEAPGVRADEILSVPTSDWDAAAPADEAPIFTWNGDTGSDGKRFRRQASADQ